MSLFKQLKEDLKKAQKTKEKGKVSLLRMLISDVKNWAIEQKKDFENIETEDVHTVLKKAAKDRKESIEAYKGAKRDDLVQKEKFELDTINEYLPDQLEGEQLEQKVNEVIKQTGAQSMDDMGSVMGKIKNEYGNKVDMNEVSNMVREKLS